MSNMYIGGEQELDTRPTRVRQTHLVKGERDLFLMGPIPWTWLKAAGRLPGATLKVALVLWHFSALRKSRSFRLSEQQLATFWGISLDTAGRSLDALENAGLIRVDCAPGRTCIITIIDIPGRRRAMPGLMDMYLYPSRFSPARTKSNDTGRT